MATILVVDDDLSMRTLIREMYEQAGHRVFEAANGALALLRLGQLAPDLLVTDVEMPVMDGFTLIGTVRADRARGRLPVIILSGRECPAGVADAVFRKPFEPSALLAASEELLSASPVG